MKFHSLLVKPLLIAGLSLGILPPVCAAQGPKISTVKAPTNTGIISSIGQGLWYCGSHPLLTGSVLAGLGGLYMWHCRKNARSCQPLLEKAKEITRHFDNPFGAPKNPFMYWNLFPTSSAFIGSNPRAIYTELRNQFQQQGQTESNFISSTIKKIDDDDKSKLNDLRYKLNGYLCGYHFTPGVRAQQINPVDAILDRYIKSNNGKMLNTFSDKCIEMISNDIAKLTHLSLLNPARWAHMIAFPDESEAIQQYWKLTQMVAHLEALQSLLIDRQKAINGEINRLSQID